MKVTNAQRAAMIRERVRLLAAHERHLEASVLQTIHRASRRFAVDGLSAVPWLIESLRRAMLKNMRACGEDFILLTLGSFKGGSAFERKDFYSTAVEFAQAAFEGWLVDHALKRARAIKDSMVPPIKKILREAAESGASTNETARRIAKEIDGPKARVRAQRIARTEMHTAANRSSFDAANASGVDMIKEWGATEDHRTRPSHADADGQRVEMTEQFIVGGSSLAFPGDPEAPAHEIINCRCTMLFWPK